MQRLIAELRNSGITDENVRRRWHDLRHKLLAQLLGSN